MKIYLTIITSFFLVILIHTTFSATGAALQKKVDGEVRARVLGSKSLDVMTHKELTELLVSPAFTETYVITMRDIKDDYKWHFITIGAVEVLSLLLLAFGCYRLVCRLGSKHYKEQAFRG